MGRREGNIFTDMYGNINFKMKISGTYYPTLPYEYNTARVPTLNLKRLHIRLSISEAQTEPAREMSIVAFQSCPS